jgi:hypothetical protein
MFRPYMEGAAAFDPEALDAMSRAFSQTCNALQIFAGDAHGREVIATRIVELARRGLLDANALRDRVVMEARIDA